MNNRVTSNSGNAVSLFPFLAVLLCTMGALLVLLVVYAQRVAERAVVGPDTAPLEIARSESPPESAVDQAESESSRLDELKERLTQFKAVQNKLTALHSEANEQLRVEQEKLTHLEDHTRRLEHELARMALTAEQLKATEQDQVVDQQQAERELARLQKLVDEKKERIEQLVTEAKGKRTYAIMPFLGKDGTVVPRIFIECNRKGVIVQPEGVVLDKDDFFDTAWSGNPLLQIIRATQQHMQELARAAGDENPPLPLPLLIVRPDGLNWFRKAEDALNASSIAYGYDFASGDHSLTYPLPPDTTLANKQHQARMIARRQLIYQIRTAPGLYKSKFRGAAVSSGGIGLGIRNPKAALFARLSTDGYAARGNGGTSGPVSHTASDTRKTKPNTKTDAAAEDEQIGTLREPGDRFGAGGGDSLAGGRYASDSDIENGVTGSDAEGGPGGGLAQQGVSSSVSPASDGSGIAANNGALDVGVEADNANSYGIAATFRDPTKQKPAKDRGPNESLRARRNSVPVQRPIKVIVREDYFSLLQSRHVVESANEASMISMQQSARDIGRQLKAALRDHVDEWGIAGRGLYWKPVFRLEVGPEASETAIRLAKMLAQSGFEVRLPEHMSIAMGEGADAKK